MENFPNMNPTAYNFSDFYKKWSLVHSIIMTLVTIISLIVEINLFLIIFSFASFSFYIINIPAFTNTLPYGLGYANLITCLRLFIILSVGLLYNLLAKEIIFILFVIAILLDGVDGFMARKYNHSTKPGEILDMETDAFMVLLLSMIHFDKGVIGWWILIPGSLRYIYELIVYWLKGGDTDFPPKKVRATIAVIFFIALLSPFILPNATAVLILAISSILIILSFGSSILSRLIATVKS